MSDELLRPDDYTLFTKLAALRSLECDGLSRVISYYLEQRGVSHVIVVGTLKRLEPTYTEVPLHYWIRLGDGRLIDYRAQMWLGQEPDVPNGVFRAEDYPNVSYLGSVDTASPLPRDVASLLSEGLVT